VLVDGVALDDVVLDALTPHADERGRFTEVFADHWATGLTPVQWSVVETSAGALRGMHLHRRHGEYLVVVTGRLSVGLYDAREGAASEGRWGRWELSAETPAALSIPAGFVHGWLAHEPSIHLQAVSEAYVDYADDDNQGCHWADPDLGIRWPFPPTTVSSDAAVFPSLRELVNPV
jgi:dTDP-4-dehydrorhamnose 3,5-epimerase